MPRPSVGPVKKRKRALQSDINAVKSAAGKKRKRKISRPGASSSPFITRGIPRK